MLQVYKNQNMGQAQFQAPQMRQISTGGVAGLMPTDNIVMGKKAMGAIFDAMAERQRIQDNTDLAAASSELQKQAIAFQSQYRQQNMGRDARDAGDVWAQNVGEMAGKIGEQFQGRPDLQQRFKAAADEMALRSYVSGFTYADQQEAQYRDSTTKEKLALLTNAIGTGTPMDIATAKQDYEATLALLYPGRNLQPELMAADRLVAGGLIERALAEGDIREARALYGEQKDQLGKDAPSYLSKIDAKAEALEKKWEAAQKEAAAAQFEKDVAAQSAEVLKQVNDFPDPEVRTAKAVELTKDIEDPKLKAAVRKSVDGTLKEQELQSKARLVLELDSLDAMLDQVGPDGTTYTPTARLAVIQSANVSEEAKRVATKGVYDMLDGKNNEAASASGVAAWRAWFDSTGGRASQEEMQAKMLDFGLSAADRKKATDYKGVRLEYPQQRVFSLIDSVFGKGKKNDAQKARMYEAIVTQAKASGKAMSDKELKALIYQQDAEGSIAGGERTWYGGVDTMSYAEAVDRTGGRVGLFRPEVPEDTAKQMRAILEYTQPWSKLLDKAGRDLLVQTTYLQQQMGIQLELTAEERQKFQNAINKYNAGNR